MARSIAAKLVGKVVNTTTNKLTNTAVNKVLGAMGLGNRTPKKLMPHELEALLTKNYGELGLNTFNGRQYLGSKVIDDVVLAQLKSELSEDHNVKLTKTDLREAVQLVCFQSPFSPVQRYLTGLDWDGVDRIPQLVKTLNPVCVDGDHEVLVQKMVKCFLIGAAARAIEPSVKVDDVLVLRGKQRAGKSTFFSTLGSPWFRDTMFDIESKDGLQNLQGCWVYELSELRPVLTKHPDTVKGFLSSSTDTYRAPYQKYAEAHPRSVVFTGTTNAERFLTDATGSSRFHVVEVGALIDIAGVAAIKDSLWAQAVALHKQGVQHWLDATDTELSERINARYAVVAPKKTLPIIEAQ